MEASDPTSSDTSCLRCSAETVESRRIRLKSPFLKYSDVTACGAANDNSHSNFSRDLSTKAPQEPFRPTSKTLGLEMAVVPSQRGGQKELVSNITKGLPTPVGTFCLLDNQPSPVVPGEGLL